MQQPPSNRNQFKSPFTGFLPFFWLALAGAGGILTGAITNLSGWIWGLGLIICIILWMLVRFLPRSLVLTHRLIQWTRADRRLPGLLLGVCFFFCGWRYADAHSWITPETAAFYNERGKVVMVGLVIEPPDRRDTHTKLTVSVENLTPLDPSNNSAGTIIANGKILLQVQPWQDFAYGDRLRITGELQTPFETAEFSYRDFLLRQGIQSTMSYARVEIIERGQANPIRKVIYTIRDKGYETLQTLFPSPESELLAGILLGRDQGISAELQEAFRKTGTTHIIAISGFNIAILAGLFSAVFTRLFGRYWGAVAAIFSISVYALLVGGGASVVRAGIMGALGVMGGMFGRRQNGLNSLGFASLGMMAINPNILWDIGFQLSLAATSGLVLYAQPLEERLIEFAKKKLTDDQAERLVGPLCEFFLFSLAAQVMTLPITAYHFGNISWIALLANPLILPVQSLVMILGGLTLLVGMLLPGLGMILAIIAQPFVTYTIRIVTWMGKLPGADLFLPDFNPLWILLYFGVLFFLTLISKEQQKTAYRRVLSYELGLLFLLCMVVFVWHSVLAKPDDLLHLTLLDADGTVLIQSPGGRAILIGGGGSPSYLKEVLGQLLPRGGHQLDVVVVGSTMRDDLLGLSGDLQHQPSEIILWGGDPEANQTSAAVYAAFLQMGVPITKLEAGQRLDLGNGITINVHWVGERGSVLGLKWKNFGAIIPSGKVDDQGLSIPEAPDVILLKDGIKAEALYLDQINLWSPSAILFPLDDADLPLLGEHQVLSLLEGYPVLTTLDYSWIRVSTDGNNLWVSGDKR